MNTTVNLSYTSLGKISELYTQHQPEQSFVKNTSSLMATTDKRVATQLEELTTLQRALEHANLSTLPHQLESHKYHNYAVSYSALALCIIIILIRAFRKHQQRCNKRFSVEAVSQAATYSSDAAHPEDAVEPQPTPRPRFTITV